MKKTFFYFSLLTISFYPFLSKGLPCIEKQIPLSHIAADIFPDCQDDSILYFMPKELVIFEKSFDGQRSFIWREAADGSAKVSMDMHLFHAENEILKAIREIKASSPKRYKIRPYEVKDVKMEGFGGEEDGVIEQRFQTTGGFSTDIYKFFLKLNNNGVALWKENSDPDFGNYIIQGATLSYKMRVMREGQEEWIENHSSFKMASIPACQMTVPPSCKESDRTANLVARGNFFGERYFFMQYAQCSDFTDNYIFQTPSRSEVSESNLSTTDIDVIYNAVLTSFENAKKAQRSDCQTFIDNNNGYLWMKNYCISQHIRENPRLWPFSKISEMLPHSSSEAYRLGVQKAYNECVTVPVSSVFRCDGRMATKNKKCGPSKIEGKMVCFSPDIIKEVTGEEGECRYNTFRTDQGVALINSKVILVPLSEAKKMETCFEMKSPIASHFVLGQVECTPTASRGTL